MFRCEVRPGVELRILEERDAEQVFAAVDANRDHLRQWLPWVDATHHPEHTREFIRKSLEQFARNEGFSAGIRIDGAVAGAIGFLPINWTHRKAEIGYWLAKEHEGKGVMTDCARVVVQHALEELQLHRVEIRCVAGNLRSAAVANRLGFQEDGILREAYLLHGAFQDLHVFGQVKQS